MFPFPPSPLISVRDQSRGRPRGVAPFGHPRIKARQAAPRGFSQPRHVLPRPRGARASAARRVSLRRSPRPRSHDLAVPPTTADRGPGLPPDPRSAPRAAPGQDPRGGARPPAPRGMPPAGAGPRVPRTPGRTTAAGGALLPATVCTW